MQLKPQVGYTVNAGAFFSFLLFVGNVEPRSACEHCEELRWLFLKLLSLPSICITFQYKMASQAYLSKLETAGKVVEDLSLRDKIRLLSGKDMWHLEPFSSSVASCPPICLTDGPHGLRKQENLHETANLVEGRVPATCFPTAACMACSWDPDLISSVGVALAHECKNHDVPILLGPGLNIKRHVCGGRNFEYYSEDPLLSGMLARSLVQGIQSEGVAACVKHIAVNNQEHRRMKVDAIVDERTLREIYLRGFELCISPKFTSTPPVTLMCAYNRLNGEFCSQHKELWQDIVRDEWSFRGVVMTDWGATGIDRGLGVQVGVDLEMPGSHGAFDSKLRKAVKAGDLPEEAIDKCAARNVALSLMGQEVLAQHTVLKDKAYQAQLDVHHELARKVASQCAVLLKNEANVLPLQRNSSVTVYGELACFPRYQGMGSSEVRAWKVDSALDRIREYSDMVQYHEHLPPASEVDADDMPNTTAVVFVGLPEIYESEGMDRAHIRLPDEHNVLVQAVARRHSKVVVVLMHGGPIAMPWADSVTAILTGFLAGQAGSSALADLLFGVASPCGRLAETLPVKVEDQLTHEWFPGEADQVEHREGLNVGYRGYDAVDRPVLFPFGHGLSYTSFEYSALQAVAVSSDEIQVKVSLQLKNTGSVRAAEVVQCYIHDVESTVYRPKQELKAFKKIWLDPGQTETVEMELKKEAFSFYDIGISDWIVEPGQFEIRVGSSSRDIRTTTTVDLKAGTRMASEQAQKAHPPTLAPIASDKEFANMLEIPKFRRPELEVWPYNPNTLLNDLDNSTLGRKFANIVRREATRGLPPEVQEDEAELQMVRAVVDNVPLRGLVMFSRGSLTFADLDLLLAILNHNCLRSMMLVWPSLKSKIWKS